MQNNNLKEKNIENNVSWKQSTQGQVLKHHYTPTSPKGLQATTDVRILPVRAKT